MRLCLELNGLTLFYRSRATTAAPVLVSRIALVYLGTDDGALDWSNQHIYRRSERFRTVV